MTSTQDRLKPEEHFTTLFADTVGGDVDDPRWLRDTRKRAFERFSELGFPSRRDEAFRCTPVGRLTGPVYALPGPDISAEELNMARQRLGDLTFWEESALRLTFVNGRFAPTLSSLDHLPDGLDLRPRSVMLQSSPTTLEESQGPSIEHSSDAFFCLNTAFARDGACVILARGVALERTIHLIFLSGGTDTPQLVSPRNLVTLGHGSSCRIVETYATLDETSCSLTNAVTEYWIQSDASVDHYKVQRENTHAFHLSQDAIHLEANAGFDTTAMSLGAAIGRCSHRMEQGGPHTRCHLNGLFVVDGERVIDHFVLAHHTQDFGQSEQLYKGIVRDRGLGSFNGAIIAEEGVRGTEAHQTNKNLLLSNEAEVQTRPQLEIYCDDIACSHGATVGQLDDDALFYLRSRGLDESLARSILTRAFAGDVVERIHIEKLRQYMADHLAQRVLGEGETP